MTKALDAALAAVKLAGNPQPVPPQDYLGLPWSLDRHGVLSTSQRTPDTKPTDFARPTTEGLPARVDLLRLAFAVRAANMHHRVMTALEDAVPLLRAMQALAVSAPAANTTARELADRIVQLIGEAK